MDKSVIINRIIAETNSISYLEIGYADGFNFAQIQCGLKNTIEPDYNGDVPFIYKGTSDDFFNGNSLDFDVIFIDGDHTAEQVRKDIINSLKCNPKAIILHDTIPYSEEMQEVPRNTKEWTGDVWRAVVGFKQSYPLIKMETYTSDYGLTVIYPKGKKARKHFENMEMTYEEFNENKVELLNII